jgi:hypothetical protein
MSEESYLKLDLSMVESSRQKKIRNNAQWCGLDAELEKSFFHSNKLTVRGEEESMKKFVNFLQEKDYSPSPATAEKPLKAYIEILDRENLDIPQE